VVREACSDTKVRAVAIYRSASIDTHSSMRIGHGDGRQDQVGRGLDWDSTYTAQCQADGRRQTSVKVEVWRPATARGLGRKVVPGG
jgi:hypothetical protein